MNEGETYPVELGGRRWELRRLPFRIVKQVQPGILKHAAGMIENSGTMQISEDALSAQTQALALALQTVDPALTVEGLEDLPFSVAQFVTALGAVLRACGLGGGESPDRSGDGAASAAS